jgi:hypothetical protein
MSFEAYSFWNEDYILREKEFLDIVTYVPLDINHSDVWSLKLANLLILVGSSIDFLQSAMMYCLIHNINKKINKLDRWSYKYDLISNELELLLRLQEGGKKVGVTKMIT